MAKNTTPRGVDTPPTDFASAPPRDLHPTSDIRFVIIEVAKLTTQVERLIQDVEKIDTKVEGVCHQVTFVKGALWVIAGVGALLGIVITLYLSGVISVTVTPGS